ncbi:unnamed protein product, partial [Symbiodinium microadriaticum]
FLQIALQSPLILSEQRLIRLMTVLENLTTLVANSAASTKDQSIKGRDLAKVLKHCFRRSTPGHRLTVAVQLAKFESAVSEYENLSGSHMSDDNKLAAVLRCLSGQLRTQATVLITESSTYQDLRSLIERWDTSQTKWSASIASTFGISASSSGGPQPMEVDRVQQPKGKYGRDPKGKGKGKGGKEGKGKYGKPPDPKGGRGGKGKDKGHLEKDCWLKQKHAKGRVNQVSDVHASDSVSQAATSSTAAGVVRRVQVFDLCDTSSWFAGGHVRAITAEPDWKAKAIQCSTGPSPEGAACGAPGGDVEFPDFTFLDAVRISQQSYGGAESVSLPCSSVERFECQPEVSECLDVILARLESRGNPVSTGGDMSPGGASSAPSFDMSVCDEDDPWTLAASTFDLQSESDCSGIPKLVCAVHSINMLMHEAESHEVILDSGADMSCLPLSYAGYGTSHASQGLALRDAQGESLAVSDLREVEFILEADSGEPLVSREVCAIAPLTQPLLCKGKLMLVATTKTSYAAIYRVGEQSVSPERHVRFVQVTVDASMLDAPFGWQMSEQGDMFYRGRGSHFVDPSIIAPVGWPCRTTIVKPLMAGHEHWILLEHCVSWGELQELAAVLPHGECEVVCVLSTEHTPLEDMMIVPSRSVQNYISWSGPQPADPNAVEFDDYEPDHDDEMDGVYEPHEVSVDPLPEDDVVPDVPSAAKGSDRDILVYDGVELSLRSTLNVIRASCKAAGLSQSGSKQRCLDRLRSYLEKQDIALRSEVAQAVEGDASREARSQTQIREPTAAERQLHNLTHWPYKGWCDHCLSMKGLEYRHESIPDSRDRDTPIVSFDFAYTSVTTSKPDLKNHKLTILVAHDTATGSVFGLPVPSKGKDDLKFAAIELTRFVQSLGHNTIALQTDNEPSTVALQNLIIGYVEKTVDLLRGFPWNYQLGVLGTKIYPPSRHRVPQPADQGGDDLQPVETSEVAASDPPSPETGTPIVIGNQYRRIARVGTEDFPINDEVLESAPEWEDAEVYAEVVDADSSEWDVTDGEDSKALESEDCLWFSAIPELSEQAQLELDRVADAFEIKRLLRKGVLEELSADDDTSAYKELSSKFVRTWRQKQRGGQLMFFRRARLVAREYRWLERDREDLYAPATSALTTKLLPWLYCELRRQQQDSDDDDEVGVIALDIKDAFLNVPQDRPMLARIPGFPNKMRFIRMIPGQRDGTARWHSFIMDYIGQDHREHVILEDGVVIKPLADHAVNMCKLLEVPLSKRVPTPCTKELLAPDASRELSVTKATKYRSAVGIGMYVSQDRADIAFTVRVLSQKLKEPTEKCWQAAQRLAAYMICTSSYASKVHATGSRLSILEPEDPDANRDGVLLEVFCDADWSGNRQTRRSMSSSSFFLNSCCIYTSCRSQRCVSLSSTESVFYALVSASCDGIYLKRILEFLLEQPVDLCMRTDNQSCRQISMKQDVSKVRHLDGRYLWVQEKTADRTLRVCPVDGRRNPSDLGTKVPASGTRLRALLCMHGLVSCARDAIAEVGREEHDSLLSSLKCEADTLRVRRLVNKSLKVNGMQSFNSAMMIMMLSLAQCADGSAIRHDASTQTSDASWPSVMLLIQVGFAVVAILVAAKSWSLGRLWNDYSESSKNATTSNVTCVANAAAEASKGGQIWWNKLKAALREASMMVKAAEVENDRLKGVITEMDYDRIAWADYVLSEQERPAAAASSCGLPDPSNDPLDTQVYCTVRKGKAYHLRRSCHCLNSAEEIIKIALLDAQARNYKPCSVCAGGKKKK